MKSFYAYRVMSTVDRKRCLEIIGTDLGAPAECLDHVYKIAITSDRTKKQTHMIPGLHIYINRSASLREIADQSLNGFPRYSKYLVYVDEKEGNVYLLYNVQIKVVQSINNPCLYYAVVKAELSVPTNDVFEAIRFIDNNIIEQLCVEEYGKLLGDIESDADRICVDQQYTLEDNSVSTTN